MKKLIVIFLFFLFWINTSFSYYQYGKNRFFNIWWKTLKVVPWDNDSYLVNPYTNEPVVHYVNKRIGWLRFDTWSRKFYFESKWYFYTINDDFSLSEGVALKWPISCPGSAYFLYGWKLKCEFQKFDWFNPIVTNTVFWNLLFFKSNWWSYTLRAYNQNSINTFTFDYTFSTKLSDFPQVYSISDHEILSYYVNNDWELVLFRYNFKFNNVDILKTWLKNWRYFLMYSWASSFSIIDWIEVVYRWVLKPKTLVEAAWWAFDNVPDEPYKPDEPKPDNPKPDNPKPDNLKELDKINSSIWNLWNILWVWLEKLWEFLKHPLDSIWSFIGKVADSVWWGLKDLKDWMVWIWKTIWKWIDKFWEFLFWIWEKIASIPWTIKEGIDSIRSMFWTDPDWKLDWFSKIKTDWSWILNINQWNLPSIVKDWDKCKMFSDSWSSFLYYSNWTVALDFSLRKFSNFR